MKKLLAAVLALVMVLSVACVSFAETASTEATAAEIDAAFQELEETGFQVYMLVAVTDAEGNTATYDENSALILFAFNQETGDCEYGSYNAGSDLTGDPDESVEGTFETTDNADGTKNVVCTLSTDESLSFTYDTENDCYYYVDANNRVEIFMNIKTILTAATETDGTAAN